MKDNRMYSLGRVAECKNAHENLCVAPSTTTFLGSLSNNRISNNALF